jgi:hypothetical protein
MRIISFDVGMKNLAYCLFDVPDSLGVGTPANLIHKINIERWDVIDLRFEPASPETTALSTEVISAPKRTCMNDSKLAKWMFLNSTPTPSVSSLLSPSVCLYCAKCADKSKYKTPSREILQYKRKPELLPKKKLDELMDIKAILSTQLHAESKAPAPAPPAQNIKLRKADLIQEIKTILSRDYMEPFDENKYYAYITKGPEATAATPAVKPKKPNYLYAHDLDLITYGRNLMKHLDVILYSSNAAPIDMMIIENQISTLASRMKTLQGMITQYFIMKNVPQIEFISASCKLKLFTDTPLSFDGNINSNNANDANDANDANNEDELCIDASTYADRKKSGIAVCRSLGEISRKHNSDFAKWMPVFETHKKKDDLADCFLQGLWRVHLLCAV